MTGADRGSLTNASGIGWLSSNADSYVASAHVAGQSVPLSYLAHFSCRKASIFTNGIRGATPPPAGWRRNAPRVFVDALHQPITVAESASRRRQKSGECCCVRFSGALASNRPAGQPSPSNHL